MKTISSLSLCLTMVSFNVLDLPSCRVLTNSMTLLRGRNVKDHGMKYNVESFIPGHGVISLHQLGLIDINLSSSGDSKHILR